MELFKKDTINGKVRSRYKIEDSASNFPIKVFDAKEIEKSDVVITFEPKEMLPHEELKVRTKEEFIDATKEKEISYVKFSGKYKQKDITIGVDFDLFLLAILSDSEIINDELKILLNKKKENMLNYKIKKIKYGDNKVNYVPEFEDEKYRILTHFISSEFHNFSANIITCINRVIAGESTFAEFAGNSCIMKSSPKETTIECIIEGAEVGELCTINTHELKELLDDYTQKQNLLTTRKG